MADFDGPAFLKPDYPSWPTTLDVPGLSHVRLDLYRPDMAEHVQDAILRSASSLGGAFPNGIPSPQVIRSDLKRKEEFQKVGLTATYVVQDAEIGGRTVFGNVVVGNRRTAYRIPVDALTGTDYEVEMDVAEIGYWRTSDIEDLPPLRDGGRRIPFQEVVRTVVAGAQPLGIREVDAWIDPKNARSIAFFEKLGGIANPEAEAAMSDSDDEVVPYCVLPVMPYVTPGHDMYTIATNSPGSGVAR